MEDIRKELYSYRNGFPNLPLTASYRETTLPTDVILQFQYTEAEYVAAVHSYYNRAFHIGTYLIALGVVFLASLYLWFATDEPVIFFGVSIFLLIVATPLVFYFVTPRTTFRRESRLHDTYWLRFDDEGIAFKTEHINSNLDWALYQQAWENKRFFFLIYGKQMYTIIPKRVFADAEQEARFRMLTQRKIGKWVTY